MNSGIGLEPEISVYTHGFKYIHRQTDVEIYMQVCV